MDLAVAAKIIGVGSFIISFFSLMGVVLIANIKEIEEQSSIEDNKELVESRVDSLIS